MLVQSGSSCVKECFVASDEQLIAGLVGDRDIVSVPASGVTLARKGVFSAADGPAYWHFSLPAGSRIKLVSKGCPAVASVWDVSLPPVSIDEAEANAYLNDVGQSLRALGILAKLGPAYGYNGWVGLDDDGEIVATTHFSAVHKYALQSIKWNEVELLRLGPILACCLAYWPDGMPDPSGGLLGRLFARMGEGSKSSLWAGCCPQKVGKELVEMLQ